MPEQKKPGGRVYHRAAQPRKRASRTFGESADWSDHEGCEALYTNRPANLLRCLRPGQWPKNLILLAAPFFACFDKGQRIADPVRAQEDLGLALVAFVLLSAYAYVLNDLADAKAALADGASDEELKAAYEALNGAIAGLEKADDGQQPGGTDPNPDDQQPGDKPGTGEPGTNRPSGGQSTGGSGVPETGDASVTGIVPIALIGVALAGAGIAAMRKGLKIH